jgi:hypothetical protein
LEGWNYAFGQAQPLAAQIGFEKTEEPVGEDWNVFDSFAQRRNPQLNGIDAKVEVAAKCSFLNAECSMNFAVLSG